MTFFGESEESNEFSKDPHDYYIYLTLMFLHENRRDQIYDNPEKFFDREWPTEFILSEEWCKYNSK